MLLLGRPFLLLLFQNGHSAVDYYCSWLNLSVPKLLVSFTSRVRLVWFVLFVRLFQKLRPDFFLDKARRWRHWLEVLKGDRCLLLPLECLGIALLLGYSRAVPNWLLFSFIRVAAIIVRLFILASAAMLGRV